MELKVNSLMCFVTSWGFFFGDFSGDLARILNLVKFQGFTLLFHKTMAVSWPSQAWVICTKRSLKTLKPRFCERILLVKICRNPC